MEVPDIALRALGSGGLLYRFVSMVAAGFVFVFGLALDYRSAAAALLAFPLLGYKTKLSVACAFILVSGFAVLSVGSMIVLPMAIRIRLALEKLFPSVFREPVTAAFDHRLANLAAHHLDRALNANLFEGEEATTAEWESFVETLGFRYLLRSSELKETYELYRFRAEMLIGLGTAFLLVTPFTGGEGRYLMGGAALIFITLSVTYANQWPLVVGQIISVGHLEERLGTTSPPGQKK